MEPMLPPIIATIKRVASGIRKALFFALCLSMPMRANPIRLIAAKYDDKSVITSIKAVSLLTFLLFQFAKFLHFHCPDFGGKAEQVNKSFRVMVVIQISRGEGCNALII